MLIPAFKINLNLKIFRNLKFSKIFYLNFCNKNFKEKNIFKKSKITEMISPVGNLIGMATSCGLSIESLQ